MLETTRPVRASLADVLAVKRCDLVLMLTMMCSVIFVWFAARRFVGIRSVFTYWDGVNFLVQKQKDDSWIQIRGDPFLRPTNHPMKDCITPLKFHFFCVNLCVICCFGNCLLGQMLYALVMSALSVFLFGKVLSSYGFGKESTMLSLLFIALPPRWVLFRSTATYDSLFMCLILASLLFYKTDHPILLLSTCILGCATRFEFVLMFPVFAICYFLCKRNFDGIVASTCGVVVFLLLSNLYPQWRVYIVPNGILKGQAQDAEYFAGIPFAYFWLAKNSVYHLRIVHALHMVLFPSFFGAALLYSQSLPLSIFGLIYSIYVSMIQSRDMNRFAIPTHTLCFLVGLAFFFKEPPVKFVLSIAAPVAFLIEVYLAAGQMRSRQMAEDLITMLYNNL